MEILKDNLYSTRFDGEFINVYKLDECFKAIACRNNDLVKRIQYLEMVNKELEDEHYKDETLKEMKDAYNKVKADNLRGFPITEREEKLIKEWRDKHDAEFHGLTDAKLRLKAGGAIGGRYTYEFVPTSIGTFGRIRCSCGEAFDFSDEF